MNISTKINKIISIFFRIFPINKRKIICSNFLGKGYGDNPKYLADEFLIRGKNYKIVWLTNDFNCTYPKNVRPVKFGSLRAFYEMSTAALWIDNVRNSPKPLKRKKQYYLQTWHSSFPMKLVEGEVEDKLHPDYVKDAKRDGMLCDAIISGDGWTTNLFLNSFWLSEKCNILKFGLPRNDILIEKNDNLVRELKNNIGIDCSDYIILYAPTFRDNDDDWFDVDFEKLLDAFEKRTNKKCKILVRFHPNDAKKASLIPINEAIINVTHYGDPQELVLISDSVITDYSTIFADFVLSDKPVYFYTPDADNYLNSRGFSQAFYNMPFKKNNTFLELVEYVIDTDLLYISTQSSDFKKYMNFYVNGNAAKNVVDFLIENSLLKS